jgi:hypothetical protein
MDIGTEVVVTDDCRAGSYLVAAHIIEMVLLRELPC